MLVLRFGYIDWTRRPIVLRGPTTKGRRTRVVPIGTNRLLAVLEWLRLDADGEHKPNDAPVFSCEVGEPVKNFMKAWVIAVLKARLASPTGHIETYGEPCEPPVVGETRRAA